MKHWMLSLAALLLASPAFAGGGDFWLNTGLHAINFLILLIILIRMAGPKIREAMQARSDNLSKEITSAEVRFNEAEAELKLYQEKHSTRTLRNYSVSTESLVSESERRFVSRHRRMRTVS